MGWIANKTSEILWNVWILTLQLIVLVICTTLYSVDKPRRGKPPWWERVATSLWNRICSTAADVCDALELALARDDSRRRVIRARSRHQSRNRRTIVALTVLAMATHTRATERKVYFDTDSEWVGVDNRCSGCISHVRSDFVGELRESNRVIKGFGGTRTVNIKVGTLRWAWDDDTHSTSQTHTTYHPERYAFSVPNTGLNPNQKVDNNDKSVVSIQMATSASSTGVTENTSCT